MLIIFRRSAAGIIFTYWPQPAAKWLKAWPPRSRKRETPPRQSDDHLPASGGRDLVVPWSHTLSLQNSYREFDFSMAGVLPIHHGKEMSMR
jgi:hypothetical protein